MAEVVILRRNRERLSFAEFLSGDDIKTAIATIANIEDIHAFRRATVLDTAATKVAISSATSDIPISAWVTDGTMYWYSDADTAYLNADSSNMFKGYGYDTWGSGTGMSQISLAGISAARAESMNGFFEGTKIESSPIPRNWNMLKVTTIANLFYNCTKLKTADLSVLRTSSALSGSTCANSIFMGCTSLTNAKLGCDLSGVTSLRNLFRGCTSLTSFSFKGTIWGNLTSGCPSMFEGCTALYEVDLHASGLDGLRCFGDSMFRSCSHLRLVRFPNYTTENALAFGSSMFYGCSELVEVDMSRCSSTNEGGLFASAYMFRDCSALRTIYVSEDFGVPSQYVPGTFDNCVSLVGGAGTTFSSSHITSEYARIDNRPTTPGYFTYKAKPAA